jgi:putative ABC transport system permease protein
MVGADLRAMRWSALFTVFLIGLSVAIGVAVSAQERAMRQASARASDDFPLIIGAPSSQSQLILTTVYLQAEALPLIDGNILNMLAHDPRVAGAAPLAYGDIVMGYPVVGTTENFVTRWGRLQPIEGRLFKQENEAVVGFSVKLAMGEAVMPSHGVAGHTPTPGSADEAEAENRHEHTQLKIVGRLPQLNSPWDQAILIPVESVWETHGLGNGHRMDGGLLGLPFDADKVPNVPAIVVKPAQVAQAYQLRSTYRQNGTMALFPAEVLVQLYQAMGNVKEWLVLAAAINNVIVFLSILLLLVTLVGSRRRRYAILRALGASRGYIVCIVGLGATTLMTAGCGVGLMIGWGGALLVSYFLTSQTGIVLDPRPGIDEIRLVCLMIGVGTFCALILAVLASRGEPSNALRG